MPKPAVYSPTASEAGWQQQLAQAISDPHKLLQHLQLNADTFPECEQALNPFRMRVPLSYLAKMKVGDARDPLLLQVMASAQELQPAPGFVDDPVGDLDASAAPGLLHKYDGRVLLITTGACAVHCRYCFRRHFPYADHQAARRQWTPALDYIRERPNISEVILSGGDPLTLNDERLAELTDALNAVPHLRRLRIHSRLPVVLPARITDRLIELLANQRLTTSLVVHANHAQEISEQDLAMYHRLRTAGIILLNQTVLLKRVNDSVAAQMALSERLFDAGILPYYLHLLDPVQGAAHFRVETTRAVQIMDALREQLPGYLVPRLVRESAGEKSKTPVFGL